MQEINRTSRASWRVAYRKPYEDNKWELYPDNGSRPVEWFSQEAAEEACAAYRSFVRSVEGRPVQVVTTEIGSTE